ncbi:hypothetical protein N0V88_005863 [Collariella sp. IMI 366227]|nr:hypothetical protein N0V88_005863 [Collariella sp. IMI 366227]
MASQPPPYPIVDIHTHMYPLIHHPPLLTEHPPHDTAAATAAEINTAFESMCASTQAIISTSSPPSPLPPLSQLLPLLPTFTTNHPHCRGIILGTSGLGRGLDDPLLLPLFTALAASSLPIFLHPHYGLPNSVYGPRAGEYGHVLPLALGFPMETTIAVARMYLAGVFDAVPGLRMVLAHAGGTGGGGGGGRK